VVRLTLDRYPQDPDDPQAATPRFGYEAQTISSLELRYSGDSVPVVGDITLDDNHLPNIQTLLGKRTTRSRRTIRTRPARARRSSGATKRGPVFWDIDGRETSVEVAETGDRREYANVIRAKGGRDPNGDRIIVTKEDATEIQALIDQGASTEQARRVDTVNDPDLNEAETETLSRATLARRRAQRGDEVTIETLPVYPSPGYAFDLSEVEGSPVLEQVAVELAYQGRGATLEFSERLRQSRDIAALRGDVERLKDTF